MSDDMGVMLIELMEEMPDVNMVVTMDSIEIAKIQGNQIDTGELNNANNG